MDQHIRHACVGPVDLIQSPRSLRLSQPWRWACLTFMPESVVPRYRCHGCCKESRALFWRSIGPARSLHPFYCRSPRTVTCARARPSIRVVVEASLLYFRARSFLVSVAATSFGSYPSVCALRESRSTAFRSTGSRRCGSDVRRPVAGCRTRPRWRAA